MHDLLIDQSTRTSLEDFARTPVHALIICGPAGLGKFTLALRLARQLLEVGNISVDHPALRIISPLKKTISIEQIRSSQEFLKLKSPGVKSIKRVIVVEDAHCLTTEAQNAFLKVLEEPPADTIIIMTAVGERSLLPTIYSRCMKLVVSGLPYEASRDYFAPLGYTEPQIRQAFGLSNGLPGLMVALLTDGPEPHPLLASITLAKQLLGMNKFERLCMVDEIGKQKNQPADLLQALLRISRAALANAASQQKHTDIQKWHAIEQAVYRAETQLSHNAQTKLLLDNLFVNL